MRRGWTNKYGVRLDPEGKAARTRGTRTFASKREAQRFDELVMLERAGEISALVLQPRLRIAVNGAPLMLGKRQVAYVADFAYRERGRTVYEDVKGRDTMVSRLKRALVEATSPVRIRIVR